MKNLVAVVDFKYPDILNAQRGRHSRCWIIEIRPTGRDPKTLVAERSPELCKISVAIERTEQDFSDPAAALWPVHISAACGTR